MKTQELLSPLLRKAALKETIERLGSELNRINNRSRKGDTPEYKANLLSALKDTKAELAKMESENAHMIKPIKGWY